MKLFQQLVFLSFALFAFSSHAYAQSGNVSGVVLDSSGRAIYGARVAIGRKSTTTDSVGKYRFSKIAAGSRTVTASKTNFKPNSVSVNIIAKTTVTAPAIVLQSSLITPAPTPVITIAPTSVPTLVPTTQPTIAATFTPTTAPTIAPTLVPTIQPTIAPTIVPTSIQTTIPTVAPTSTPTLLPTATVVTVPAAPNLALWESNMKTYGAQHCQALLNTSSSFDYKLAATYYDAQWVFYNIFDYTKDTKWLTCAQNAEAIYRDQYLFPNNAVVPGYWIFSEGLTRDYLYSGDTRSRDAAVLLSKNASYALDSAPLSWTADSTMSREVAYNMLAFMNAEILGQPRRTRLLDFKNQALGHMNQWFVTRNAPYIRPFMVGLTAHALINYADSIGDAQILPLLKTAADSMWNSMWLPTQNSFQYTNVDTALFSSSAFGYNTGGKEAAPDLNLLIAPMYAWIYNKTGDIKYLNQADAIFNGGVTQSYLTNAKQFNQNYRWSFEYLKWRNRNAVATPVSSPTAVPTSSVTSAPTLVATATPTKTATVAPTAIVTVAPTALPTIAPTIAPTAVITIAPTAIPTAAPTTPVSPVNLPAVPNIAIWESNMKTYGLQHCNGLKSTSLSFDSKLASTYYDAQWVFYNIYDYTKDSAWIACAQNAEAVYRDQYLVPANGNLPGYWNFTRGLTEDYLRSNDLKSRDAIVSVSKNGAFGVDGTPLSSTADSTMSREVAYNMMTYMNAEIVGEPRRSRLLDLKNQAIGHMNQWFITKNAPYIRPFMVALTSHALIEYNELVGDPNILPLIKTAADFMWSNMWLPNSNAFQYTNVDTALFSPTAFAYNTGGKEPAPDLNLLIAPIYAWLYHQTGELKYINQADAIFNGGVTQAYLVNGKQFNQNYRLSFHYLKWRKLAPLVAPH